MTRSMSLVLWIIEFKISIVGSWLSEQVKSLLQVSGLGGMGSKSEVFNRNFGTAQH